MKEAVVQIRINKELKEEVEELYKSLGTSFAEAVRIFARQSIIEQGLPFNVSKVKKSAYSALSDYKDPNLYLKEKDIFEKEMEEKHGKTD